MIRPPPRSTRTTHSFPTRRSSDLAGKLQQPARRRRFCPIRPVEARPLGKQLRSGGYRFQGYAWRRSAHARQYRSEEHTSELQSLMRISYAVFCLKKKKKRIVEVTE